jgi:hypothetical protein
MRNAGNASCRLSSPVLPGSSGRIWSSCSRRGASGSSRLTAAPARPPRPPSAWSRTCWVPTLTGASVTPCAAPTRCSTSPPGPGCVMPGPGVDGLRYRDNVLAAERVLRAVPPSVPVVVASSSSVYGGALHGGRLHPSRESDPLRPCGPAAATRAPRSSWSGAAGSAPPQAGWSRSPGRSRSLASGSGRTWRSPAGWSPSEVASRSASWAIPTAPATSPTSATSRSGCWAWPRGRSPARSTLAPASATGWPRSPARWVPPLGSRPRW